MRKSVVILLALGLVLGCGPRKKAPAPLERLFPGTDVPLMISDPAERLLWKTQHFWDGFTAPDSLYFCDSLTVNGVWAEELERQAGYYITLLEQLPPEEGIRCVEHFFAQVSAFQEVHPDGPVFQKVTELIARYLYDPNSPVRSEELYQPYAAALAASPLVEPLEQQRYEREARLCGLNRPGTAAADFCFIDSAGRRRTLYGIQARLLLLIFGNPDCQACRDIQAELSGNQMLSNAISSGELKVVSVYIDEDIGKWKEHAGEYPTTWINGYDPDYVIRTDLLYHVRAIPSVYLLSEDKTVLLKDCTTERLFAALGLL